MTQFSNQVDLSAVKDIQDLASCIITGINNTCRIDSSAAIGLLLSFQPVVVEENIGNFYKDANCIFDACAGASELSSDIFEGYKKIQECCQTILAGDSSAFLTLGQDSFPTSQMLGQMEAHKILEGLYDMAGEQITPDELVNKFTDCCVLGSEYHNLRNEAIHAAVVVGLHLRKTDPLSVGYSLEDLRGKLTSIMNRGVDIAVEDLEADDQYFLKAVLAYSLGKSNDEGIIRIVPEKALFVFGLGIIDDSLVFEKVIAPLAQKFQRNLLAKSLSPTSVLFHCEAFAATVEICARNRAIPEVVSSLQLVISTVPMFLERTDENKLVYSRIDTCLQRIESALNSVGFTGATLGGGRSQYAE